MLLFLLQECNDSTVLGNILAIQRELLSARSLWRPSALSTFLDLEATEVIARLLVRVCKPSTPTTPTSTPSNANASQASLSDHSFVCSFWILSALATKGKNSLLSTSEARRQLSTLVEITPLPLFH